MLDLKMFCETIHFQINYRFVLTNNLRDMLLRRRITEKKRVTHVNYLFLILFSETKIINLLCYYKSINIYLERVIHFWKTILHYKKIRFENKKCQFP